MKFRFFLIGIILWILSALLFVIRGYHPNFFILVAVGVVMFFYGLFSR